MRLRLRRKRPSSWAFQKQQIKHGWTSPFWFVEWLLEWLAFALGNWSFVEVLESLGSFSVLIAIIFYFSESGDRLKQKHYQAWQVVNTAQGKGGSGGRIEALQELNADRVPLVGVDVSGAFLQGLRLPRAPLARSNFSAADLRNSDFAFADFSDADLHSANLRESALRGAHFRRANLSDCDFWGSDLSGADFSGANLANADLRHATLSNASWAGIVRIAGANIFAVNDAPPGFVAWALAHGAIQFDSESGPHASR